LPVVCFLTVFCFFFSSFDFYRGIRIKDASSKQKVKEILAAEEAMREMMVDDDGDENIEDVADVAAGSSKLAGATKKKSSKKVVLKKKKGKEPKVGLFSAPAAMKVD
jgi:hypothetical protein